MPLFLIINVDNYSNVVNDFYKSVRKIITEKIKEIRETEFDILNQDIRERCKNGEYGLKLRNLSWNKEFFTTVLLFCVFLALIFVK